MANDIAKIKEIGIKEVAKQTHIEAEYLEYMCDRDFAKLSKLNTLGYVKILQREYGWDLGDFVGEYLEYQDGHKNDGNEPFYISPKIHFYTKNSSFGGGWLLIIIVVALLGVIIWIFGFTNYMGNLTSAILPTTNEINLGKIAPQNEAQIAEISVNFDENFSQIVPTQNFENFAQNLEILEENLSEIPQNLEQIAQNLEPQIAIQKPTQATLYPREKIWIGTKFLPNRRKSEVTTNNAHKIDLTKEAIIVAGHGNFTLENGDKNTTFNTRDILRFHIQNGAIKQLNYEDFIELNRGAKW